MVLNFQIQNEIKKRIGISAAHMVQDGMLVGLGTGSTAAYFIEALIDRCRAGLKIKAVCSSKESENLAIRGSIPIISMDEVTMVDLTVDGADQVDSQKRMIKGGGGAHVREKILAAASNKVVIIVDESKMVEKLSAKLPIELLPFGYRATIALIEKEGHPGALRKNRNNELFVTDNGNFIYDIASRQYLHPEKENERLLAIPGVIDTGFFFNLADQVIIGYLDGHIEVRI